MADHDAKTVQVEIDGPVLTVTLSRPPANALDTATSTRLFEAFRRLNDDEALRVAILIGGPNPKNIFSAGWDLKAVARGEGRDAE
ncbi:MAG TPA: enoyl-CoA hydratase-related protein, partial [Alphaproteobacteria bacterium]|nr:enoyl-CoA hydratase-related protein [Alphaproteobacteria bacterium]